MICAPTTLAIGIRRQGSNNPVAEAQTHEALTQVLIANDGEVLARLRLSAAEAARVCNVTPRQLIYWTKKGLVKPSTDGDHDYDVFAMEKVIRIRQALEKGHSLEKAAQLVQREISTLQAEANARPDAARPRSPVSSRSPWIPTSSAPSQLSSSTASPASPARTGRPPRRGCSLTFRAPPGGNRSTTGPAPISIAE